METQKFNTHHLLFPRRLYIKTQEPRYLRNHPVMQVEMPVADHNELHARVEAPKLITSKLARVALHIIDSQPFDISNEERFYNFNERLHKMSRNVGRMGLEAAMLHENLEQQLIYIEKHRDSQYGT